MNNPHVWCLMLALCRFAEISGMEYTRFTLVIKLTTAGVDTAEKCSFKVLFGPDLSTGFAWLCTVGWNGGVRLPNRRCIPDLF